MPRDPHAVPDENALTPDEYTRLKRLLAIEPRLSEMEKTDGRVQWVVSWIGRLIGWIFIVAAGLVAIKALLLGSGGK